MEQPRQRATRPNFHTRTGLPAGSRRLTRHVGRAQNGGGAGMRASGEPSRPNRGVARLPLAVGGRPSRRGCGRRSSTTSGSAPRTAPRPAAAPGPARAARQRQLVPAEAEVGRAGRARPTWPSTATAPSRTTRRARRPARSGQVAGPGPQRQRRAHARRCRARAGDAAPASSPTSTVAVASSSSTRGQLGVVLERGRAVAGRLGLGHPELHAVEVAAVAAGGLLGVGHAVARRSSG